LHEVGGLDPLMASGATLERSRLLAGAEIGHYWIVDRKVLDLSAYANSSTIFRKPSARLW